WPIIVQHRQDSCGGLSKSNFHPVMSGEIRQQTFPSDSLRVLACGPSLSPCVVPHPLSGCRASMPSQNQNTGMSWPSNRYYAGKPAERAAATYRAAPHNVEAEQALRGATLVNNEALYRVSDFLEPQHFFEPIHQQIYDISRSLIRTGKLASPVTLKTFLPAETDIA